MSTITNIFRIRLALFVLAISSVFPYLLYADDGDDIPLSIDITYSEMVRCPQGMGLDYVYNKKWQYSVFTELEAMLNARDTHLGESESEIVDYAIDYLDQLVEADGTIYKYKMSDYNLDHIKGGTLLLYAYERTGKEKYLKAADTLWTQLKNQPTTSDGGYWHKNIYPYQMWLDGLFMAEPFAALYASKFLAGQELEDAFTKIVKQFSLVTTHTFDPATELYRHGWDEKKAQPWADKTTGQSAHAWGRAMGWTFMAMPYVLELMPADHPKRGELESIFRTMAAAVVSAQDPESGLWWQVLDCPGRKGNYLEATASAMFVYTLLRGARMQLLDESFRQAGVKGWNGILDRLLVKGTDGSVTLTQCCSVGGLGGNANRDGSFEYYISEPIRDNDAKGMGPLINAAVEIELLEGAGIVSTMESSEISAIFDLQGHRIYNVESESLHPGIYIMTSPGRAPRKMIVR